MPKYIPNSMRGKTELRVMVLISALPIYFHQRALKSPYSPPVRPKFKGYSERSAFTSISKKAVLKKSM
jgi:hypothetical protein